MTDRQADPCMHPSIRTWVDAETKRPAKLWSCIDCNRRFFPGDELLAVELQRDELRAALAKLLAHAKDCDRIMLQEAGIAIFDKSAIGAAQAALDKSPIQL